MSKFTCVLPVVDLNATASKEVPVTVNELEEDR